MKEMVGGCCVCSDERGWDENPLVYCDGTGCNVAVHQACYGIVSVPSGPWFCRKCESQERSTKVKCELCPCREGALKQTDTGGWAHVVCALYIPEVRFGNVTTMEPILISLIPPERFNKSCYICEETSKGSKPSFGAFMQCNKPGCKQNFHVTCAQMMGLLCEEAGNMMDNVKYCGYCQYHYGKLKKTSNMKIIPPFRPASNNKSHSGHAFSDSGVGKDQLRLSSDMNNKMSLKKKPTASSSTSSNSKTASSHHPSSVSSSSGATAPRIAPSNLFSANSFPQSLSKTTIAEKNDGGTSSSKDVSSSSQGGGGSSKEDSFVLKSEDLKSKNSGGSSRSNNTNGSTNISEPKKFLKTGNTDFMTAKLDGVITASLNRPIHDLPPRDKSQPPDIKPHVTLTPIPLRSSDKLQEKSTVLFPVSQSGSANVSTKSKEIHEIEKSMAEISPAKFSSSEGAGRVSPVKRSSSRLNTGFESSASGESRASRHSERESRSSVDRGSLTLNWESVKQQHSAPVTGTSISEDQGHSSSRKGDEVSRKDPDDPDADLSQTPPKRGPGRPIKRRSGPGRDEERLEEHQLRKKSKRGGRPGNNSGSSSRRDDSEPPTLEDNSNYERKRDRHHRKSSSSHNHSSSSVPHSKDDNPNPTNAPTLSQLKQQQKQNVEKVELPSPSSSSNNNSTTVPVPVRPTHMFGNTLNPSSSMAQRMVDTLSQEMETMVAAGVGFVDRGEKPTEKLVGIPLPKYSSSPLLNEGSPSTPNPNGESSVDSVLETPGSTSTANSVTVVNGVSNVPQTLEQLLERQWEQGSQFLMEQAQHLDVAQLLSCLSQLKQDNRTLEEHVTSLLRRKEQLIAINVRLSIPLSSTLGTTVTSIVTSLDAAAASETHALRPGSSDPPPPVLQPEQPATNRRPVILTGHPVPVVTSRTCPSGR